MARGTLLQGRTLKGSGSPLLPSSVVNVSSMLPAPSGGDDSAALNAAVTAAGAGAVLVARPNVVYKVASPWVLGQANQKILMQGSTVQKILTGGAANFIAVNATAAGVILDLGGGAIDGRRTDQPAASSGAGFANNSNGIVILRSGDVKSCGSHGVIDGATAGCQTNCRDIRSYDHLDPSNARAANGFVLESPFRLWACRGTSNQRSGLKTFGGIIGSASGFGFIGPDCHMDSNVVAGYELANTGTAVSSIAPSLNAVNNGNYGALVNNGVGWDIGTINAEFTGNAVFGNYVDGSGTNSAGSSLTIQGTSTRINVGVLNSRAPAGYGASLNGGTDLQIGTINTDQTGSFDGDPGVQIGGSLANVRIGTINATLHTVGLVIGDSAGAVSNIRIGRLHTDSCPYGAALFNNTGSSDIVVGEIVDHNSYTTDGTKPGLVEFLTGSSATIGKIIQSNDGTHKPTYIIHAAAGTSNCTVREIQARVFVTAAISDAGTSNDFPWRARFGGVGQVGSLGLASERSLWVPGGSICETMSRDRGPSNVATLASGTLYLAGGLVLPAGKATASGTFWSATTALTMGSNADGHLWFCLVRQSDTTVVAISDDVGGAAAWAANSAKTLPWTSSLTDATWANYTPTQDMRLYLGVMISLGTGGAPALPTLHGIAFNTTGALRAVAPILAATWNTTPLTTPIGVTAQAGITNTSVLAYGYIS